MFYLSLALIFLGILIFVYSIIADAMHRRGDLPSGEWGSDGPASRPGPAGAAAQTAPETRRIRPSFLSKKRKGIAENRAVKQNTAVRAVSPEGRTPSAEKAVGQEPDDSEMTAVLFEDNSRIIDYDKETVSIDPGLAGYKKIRRVGSGRLSIEKAGISFHMGKKLYRYDFHRVRDIKTGSKHLAVFLAGSDSVKLFIFIAGSAAPAGVADAYGEYLGSSE